MDRTEKTTRYYYDDQRVAVQTLVSDGVETDDRYFVFGGYIDEVLVMGYRLGTSWLNSYYGHDHLYSPVALFAANGFVVERYEYDVYGQVQILTANYDPRTASSLANPYTFTGRELDTLDAGSLTLMYYRARTYDPQTGRFMQRDPLKYVDSMNLYEYVSSKPLINLDPYGTKIISSRKVDYWIDSHMPYRKVQCKKGGCCIRVIGRIESCEFRKRTWVLKNERYEWAPEEGNWWSGYCKKTHTRYLADREKFTGPVINWKQGWKTCTYTIEVATFSNPFAGKIIRNSNYQIHIYEERDEVVFLSFSEQQCKDFAEKKP